MGNQDQGKLLKLEHIPPDTIPDATDFNALVDCVNALVDCVNAMWEIIAQNTELLRIITDKALDDLTDHA